jgi:hypothetical protein
VENGTNNTASANKRLVKTLLCILGIKLFLVFVVLKIFFFPDFLNERFETDAEKSDYVGSTLVGEHN